MTRQIHPIPAVRALIENRAGQILLLQRTNTNYGNNLWCLPGGKVDVRQTVEEALENELSEELSVRLTSARFLFYQDSLPMEPGGLHFINFYFHCEVEGEPAINEESSDYVWIGPEGMTNYKITFNNDEAIRRHFSL